MKTLLLASLFLLGFGQPAPAQTLELHRSTPTLSQAQDSQAAALYETGKTYQAQGDYEAALATLEQALAAYEALQDNRGIAQTLVQLGKTYDGLGDYENMGAVYQRALEVAQTSGDQQQEAYALNGVGDIYYYQQQYDEAQPYYEQALAIFETLGDDLGKAESLLYIGNNYQGQQNYEAAEPFLVKSLALYEQELGETDAFFPVYLNNLGNLYIALERYEDALAYLNRALKIQENNSDRNPYILATTLEALGSVYTAQAQYPEAEEVLQQALSIREVEQGSENLGLTNSLYPLANLYLTQERNEEAIVVYERALAIVESQLGAEHPATVGLKQAIQNLNPDQQPTEEAQIDPRLQEADRLQQQVIQLYQQGRYEEGIAIAQQVLEIRESILGDHPDTATILLGLGLGYQNMGRYSEAEPLYQRSLSIYESQLGNDHLDTVKTLNDLARLYNNMERYEEAITSAEKALAIQQQELGDNHLDFISTLNILATAYNYMSKNEQAKNVLVLALKIRENQLGLDHILTASTLYRLGSIYEILSEYSKAESVYQRAFNIREQQLGVEHSDTLAVLDRLALVNFWLGKFSDAATIFERILSIQRNIQDVDQLSLARTLNQLANIYSRLQRSEDQINLLEEALKIEETHPDSNNRKIAGTLNNLGLAYLGLDQYEEAEKLFQRSLSLHEQEYELNPRSVAINLAVNLDNLGVVYSETDREDEAEAAFTRSLTLREGIFAPNNLDIALSLDRLANLSWSQENFQRSLELLSRGLEIQEANILGNLVFLTETEQRTYLSQVAYTEDKIVSLHLQHLPNHLEATQTALTTILRRKGRILDTLSNNLQRIRANASREDLARLENLSQLQTELTNLYSQGISQEQLQSLQSQIEQLQKELAQNTPEFNPEPITIETIQNLLPTDAALIEFFQYRPYDPEEGCHCESEPRYAAYILKPQSDPVGIDLGEAKAIDTRLGFLRQQLTDPGSTGRLRQISQQVYQAVFQPLEPYLDNVQHLLISPDGNLNLIPFAALMDQQGQYLLEKYQLTALSSGRDLVTYQRTYEAAQPPLIVANPSYNTGSDVGATQLVADARTRGGITIAQPSTGNSRPQLKESSVSELQSVGIPFPWSDLPGTKREAELIAPKLPLSLTLTEEKATEGAVKTVQSPSILHFATHGFFLPVGDEGQNPLVRSGLILAGANLQDASKNQGEDGVLTALEVSGLDLRGTQLVVMSACDTGKGEVANGEGVYGLRRAFTLAGAESQLFSLWEVNDWATQALLTRYYDYLLEGRGRSEAWRQTQLDMLRGNLDAEIDPQGLQSITNTAHPNYWAAFIPAGNWEPMTLE